MAGWTAEELDIFFDTADFAEDATIFYELQDQDLADAFSGDGDDGDEAPLSADISVTFENAYLAAGGVESLGPAALCRSSVLTGVRHNDTILIGSAVYHITGIHQQDNGMTLLMLSLEEI